MEFLTDFADQAVAMPLAAVVAFGLALCGWWRGLLAWLLVVPGVLGLMGFLKFLFYSCATLDVTGIHSPSGHTSVAAAIYGGMLVLLLRGRLPDAVVFAIPPALAIVVGITRVAVHAHVPIEVVVGGAVGLVGAAMLAVLAGPRPPLRRNWPIWLGATVVVVIFHGIRLHLEDVAHHFWLYAWLPLPALCHA